MTIQMIANGLLIVALVGWMGYKQLTWRPVDVGRLWVTPAIFALAGLVLLAGVTNATALTGTDIAILTIELVISLVIGVVMGLMGAFRPMSQEAMAAYEASRRGRRHTGPAVMESRTGWWGIVLWVALIGVRVLIDVFAVSAGSELAASAGVILLMIGANRAARAAVFAYRLGRVGVPAA